jgi:hypothetical protein
MISRSEAMDQRLRRLRALEGHAVGLALADGSRIERGHLVSVASGGTVWLVVGGVDRFVALEDVIDCWEAQGASQASGSRRSRGEGGPRCTPSTHPRRRAARPLW